MSFNNAMKIMDKQEDLKHLRERLTEETLDFLFKEHSK